MSDIRWDRYLGVRWDHVDWLYDHPEHIDRESPSREEAIALKRVIAGDRRILVNCGWPTIPPPLSHFDRLQYHRRPAEGPDPHHRWLRFQLACQFAGFQDPPDIERMQVWLRAERPDPGAVPALYNLFTCMNPSQIPHLLLGEKPDCPRAGPCNPYLRRPQRVPGWPDGSHGRPAHPSPATLRPGRPMSAAVSRSRESVGSNTPTE